MNCHCRTLSTAVAAASDKQTLLLPTQPLSLIDMHQCDAWSPCPILRNRLNTTLQGATTTLMGVTKFERFFRAAAGLDVDQQDLKRYSDFVNHKIYDLLVRGRATAKANGRDVIDPHDVPITKGLQECIHAFTKLDGEIELKSIVDHITARPPLDLAIRDETEARLAAIAGDLSVALARAFKLINPAIKNPATDDWERATQIFDLLL